VLAADGDAAAEGPCLARDDPLHASAQLRERYELHPSALHRLAHAGVAERRDLQVALVPIPRVRHAQAGMARDLGEPLLHDAAHALEEQAAALVDGAVAGRRLEVGGGRQLDVDLDLAKRVVEERRLELADRVVATRSRGYLARRVLADAT